MNLSPDNSLQNNLSAVSAEDTLRLLASLPAPDGLEERVRSRLRERSVGHVLAWPVKGRPMQGWLRSAAAAAIVCVVAGGSWGVYSHVQPMGAVAPLPRQNVSGGFSSAGAIRVPLTIQAVPTAASVQNPTKQTPQAQKTQEIQAASPASGSIPAKKHAKNGKALQ